MGGGGAQYKNRTQYTLQSVEVNLGRRSKILRESLRAYEAN